MRPRLLLLLWLLTDLLLFVALYAVAYFIRVGWIFSSNFPFAPFFTTTVTVAPLWLLVLATTRTFALTRNQRTLRNAAYIAYAALVGVALFTLAYYFRFKDSFQGVSRLLLLEAFVLTAGGTWLWHLVFDTFRRMILRRFPPSFPTLIIGVTREAQALIAQLRQHRNPLVPVAILDGHGSQEREIHGVPVLGKLDRLEEILVEKRITHLIQCSDLEQTLNLLSACQRRSITYMLLPSVLGIVERDERVESLEGHPVTVVAPEKRGGWFFR
ncbi:MAG TPA: hypothetical protein DEB30_04330 [Candidatus Peribacter riflensis]|uniref:Uncharacterized protein n=1 Tax=Candidatus Peribacter riflensis TaxID=1735162 RepID=A0A0S1SJ23_9BACT|nr:MAG: hypothetical protein PeribacterA2_0818 [Candidatus Peribacter riflensis]OGJ77676.1 MAG: hypothetical protein A2398_04340 [Candidatus Peribacteria bacterium RIFOXYB1_FULL_57_12]OGJ78544.1 MAG: hypothetical protein A2412_03100 [Candidatus Peribacteria bacterium RIFOXYC1_FULL_58_8]ALM11284.1 MAG: hypothetical protein PeribacterB2_0820 [Candidatus Peribacter riflensis]ALM12386.1 MAG: hypothetical protein PeribacterC2_0819 [Candidatus Peribacter riflensis]